MKTVLLLAAMMVVSSLSMNASENMLGRQSRNEGMIAVPAPGPVAVDGDLSDWDWSGRIWCFADSSLRTRYSVEAAAMWDKDYLYLAAKWKDPTPMQNVIDPQFNPNEGWKGDCWQMRILSDQLTHATAWYSTPGKISALHLTHSVGGSGAYALYTGANPGELIAVDTKQKDGAEMAFKLDGDGVSASPLQAGSGQARGYVQEMRIPWKLLFKDVPDIASGVKLRFGNEFMWGNPQSSWPMHRYADNMQPGQTSREFFWTNTKAWGDLVLGGSNKIDTRQYVEAGGKLQGTVPVRISVPNGSARFTIAIDDANGKRIRNLAGDFDPQEYAVGQKDGNRVVEVLWDCLDDKGRPVQPGSYKVRGLSHEGLDAEYDMSFYNPGTPQWGGGAGAWGADHCPPSGVAAAGEMVFVAWAFPEGGSGIIGIGPDGMKKWGDKHGAIRIAAAGDYVYAISDTWYVKGVLVRMAARDGAYRPFVLDGRERPFEIDLKDVFSADASLAGIIAKLGSLPKDAVSPISVQAMSVSKDMIVLSLACGQLAILDANSAKLLKTLPVAGMTSLAFSRDGKLYGLVGNKTLAINTENGTTTPISVSGLGNAAALAVDADGNLLIADRGPDNQVKAFSPDGKLVYTCGQKGGRPLHGVWQPEGMLQASSVATDSKGQVWVTENWDFPRRVSVWARTGKLVRDYVGNTGYAGDGAFLDERDPSLAYEGGVEMKIDHSRRTYRVSRILWVPDEDKNQAFWLGHDRIRGNSFRNHSFVYSSASGTERRYLFNYDDWMAVYMEKDGSWLPVAAVAPVKSLPVKMRESEFKDLADKDVILWNDANGDGCVARLECTVAKGKIPLGRTMTDWGRRMGADLSMYANPVARFKPIGFSASGAPKYGEEGIKNLLDDEGDLVPVDEENRLLCLSFRGYPKETTGMIGVDMDSGAIQWSIPNRWPSVHGSHSAPMPRPGVLVGPLRILGQALVGKDAGRVFGVRGNHGQDFFMTTDGLFVGALFQDGRLPSDTLPATEAELVGRPMAGFSNGGEAFNGWFGRQSDGVCRMIVGFGRESAMILQVKGLETIRKTTGADVVLDEATIAKARIANSALAAGSGKAAKYAIARAATPPAIDGDLKDFEKIPAMKAENEGGTDKADVRMMYDDQALYVFFSVQDISPWKNTGKDWTRLFKTGDCCDLQFSSDPGAGRHTAPKPGDIRIVFAPFEGKPTAVLMRPVDPSAPKDLHKNYSSPIGQVNFERVEQRSDIKVAVKQTGRGYDLVAAIPLPLINLKPGSSILGDCGIISSNADGTTNVARTYWSNKATGLVSDLPGEASLYPENWGEWEIK